MRSQRCIAEIVRWSSARTGDRRSRSAGVNVSPSPRLPGVIRVVLAMTECVAIIALILFTSVCAAI
ncbi:hypothetical protein MMEU_0751 [Mycobacterium marinum str. Europe]|nr:hypothetical protein MMEU_0751 [Mycobacterium marinum str. Europe]